MNTPDYTQAHGDLFGLVCALGSIASFLSVLMSTFVAVDISFLDATNAAEIKGYATRFAYIICWMMITMVLGVLCMTATICIYVAHSFSYHVSGVVISSSVIGFAGVLISRFMSLKYVSEMQRL